MDCPVMQEVTVSTVGTAAEVIGKVAETTTVIVGGMGVMRKKGGGKGLVATRRGIEDMEGSDGILLAGMCKVVPLTEVCAMTSPSWLLSTSGIKQRDRTTKRRR